MEIRDLLKKIEGFSKAGRKNAYIIIASFLVPLFVLIGGYTAVSRYSAMKRTAAVKEDSLRRFKSLEEEYLIKRSRLDSLTRKAPLTAGDSAVSILEDTAKAIGINERVASLKPLSEKQASGYIEKEAEIKVEGIDLNQLVNFLYQIEANRFLLVTKEFSAKSRFDDPELLDIRLKVSFFSKSPA
ncbi:MAG: hypothetical protein Q7T24_02045 [Deltaproteobacteria bacterium]|nr:hypothetical protein [Deltaproteobacteria bacterium]